MSQALFSTRAGGPETLDLRSIDLPQPGPGEVRVAIRACGLNFPDALIIEDKYQIRPDRPFVPGGEIAGEIDGLGAGVTGWSPGDQILAITFFGGLATHAIIPADQAIALPAGADPVEGAALLLTYGTALHALTDRASLVPGETLLVLGAAGGVGLAAVELGKLLGARVVAAVSNEAKARTAMDAGADRVMIYPSGPLDADRARELGQQFKQEVGSGGANVIFDPVGGDYCEPALRSIAWAGRYLVVGFPAGIPRLALNLPLLKSCDVRGVFWGAFIEREPERHRRHVDQLFAWWQSGAIRPRIDQVFDLADGAAAIRRLSERTVRGKIVVTMG